jgi:Fic family protein
MRLRLSWDERDTALAGDFEHLLNRQYVIQSLLPSGYERYFRQHARYINAHTSTAIEGNPLGETHAMYVLVEGPDHERPAEVEKANVETAYTFVDQLAEDSTLIMDQGLIRSVNSLLLRGIQGPSATNRGKYRPGQSLIVDSQTREVRYVPPPPEHVLELMGNFVSDVESYREGMPGAVAAALTHFGLVSIHPFDDGNGRTARLLADLVLWQSPTHFERMLTVSKSIFDDREAYYLALRESQGPRFKEAVDATPFVKYHTGALCRAADDLEKQIIEFNRQRDSLYRQADGTFNERQVAGIMFMLDIGPISSSAYAALTETSQSTAITDLNMLVKQGMCLRQGTGKNTRYHVASRVRSGGD